MSIFPAPETFPSFENIAKGDTVVIAGSVGRPDRLATVTHVTPKQFAVGPLRFNKADGRRVGDRFAPRVLSADADQVAATRQAQEARSAVAALVNTVTGASAEARIARNADPARLAEIVAQLQEWAK